MNIIKTTFGKTQQGELVDLYTLRNNTGMTVKITNYGGIITSLLVPDKFGQQGDVVLGFDCLEPYLDSHPYFGTLIGRVANRIANASFTLDGNTYTLAANDGKNHLHGGIKAFDKIVWQATAFENQKEIGLELAYLSKDKEEGYPGNLSITATYAINNNNELLISYRAQTDKATPIDLTHHSYFNLKDGGASSILDHQLTIYADRYSPSDDNLIPLGKILPVIDSALDFTTPKAIGTHIADIKGGYDHYYALNNWEGNIRPVAKVTEPVSGRVMDVLTTEPGVQFYTSNFLDGSIKGKNNTAYHQYAALCLETQHFPGAVLQNSFPSIILNPGKIYRHKVIYRFK
jgi:aldose 1-epimerase